MSDAVLVSLIAGTFSTITGGLGLLGIWLTKRDVKAVRHENTQQHQTAQEERESAVEGLRRAHSKILGKVDVIHEDVRTVIGHVAVVDQKLDDHLKTPHH